MYWIELRQLVENILESQRTIGHGIFVMRAIGGNSKIM